MTKKNWTPTGYLGSEGPFFLDETYSLKYELMASLKSSIPERLLRDTMSP